MIKPTAKILFKIGDFFRHVSLLLLLAVSCQANAADCALGPVDGCQLLAVSPVKPPPAKVPKPKLIGQEIQKIIERGYIVVAMPSADSPPFFFAREGQMMGLDIELINGLARELGVEVRYNRSRKSFNDAVNLVVEEEADIAWCKLSRTLTRAKAVNFSNPYLVLHHSLAINRVRLAELTKKNHDIASVVRDFDQSLAVIEGSSYVNFAHKNFPKAKVVEVKDYQEVVESVRSGAVTAAYRDDFEIKRLIKIDPTISLTVRTVTLTDLQDSLGVAVRHEDIQLLAFINMYLEKQPVKLSIDYILNKYELWLQ